jgi:hypothetical protein
MEYKMESLDINSLVVNQHHGLLRLGVITDKHIGLDGWTYFKVMFFEDGVYRRNCLESIRLAKKDKGLDNYRADQIKPVNPQWLQNVMEAYGRHQDERRTEFG